MTVWNKERKAQLRQLWDQKPQLSARQIGDIMNVSRNAIIGCAHREGFPSRKRIVTTSGAKIVPFRKPKPRPAFKTPYKPPVLRQEPVLSPVEPVSFLMLKKDQCGAIVRMGSHLSGAEPLYCGAPLVPGKNWCASHFALYTQKQRGS